MTTSACPDRAAWKALLRGHISPNEEQRLQRHLDVCPRCQKELEASAGSTTFLLDLAGKLQRTHSELSPDLVNILDTAKGDEADATQIETRHPLVGDPTTLLARCDNSELLGMLDAFEVLEVLGQGGMGVVFKARDPKLRRLTAIKVLSPYLLSDQVSRQRFLREARAAAAVNHPNAVTIYSVHDPDDGPNVTRSRCPYLVMEFVEGPSLHRRIARNNPLPVADVLRIASHVAAALNAFHERGLIHRDVKPANILLDQKTGRAKLTDFGLTRGPEDVSLTKSGIVVGTPAYMSPEQALGQAVDARSDLFSLGSVMFAMLAGRAPFRDQDTVQTLLRLQSASPPSISTVRDDLPPDLVRLIDRLHAKNPGDRPSSSAQVLAELRRLRGPLTDSAAMPSMTLPALRGSNEAAHSQAVPIIRPTSQRGPPTESKPQRTQIADALPSPRTMSLRLRAAMLLLATLAVSLLAWAFRSPNEDVPSDSVKGKTTETSNPSESVDSKRQSFGLLREDGSVSQSAETLSAALALDTSRTAIRIRVRGRGPFPMEPLIIRGRQVSIEAAEGERPVFVFNSRPLASQAAMIDTNSTLTLAGLELQSSDLANPAEPTAPLIHATGSELRLVHCCLRGNSTSSPLIRSSASRVSIRNSMLFAGATTAVSWTASAKGTLALDNNVFAGFGALLVESPSPPPIDNEIRLADNTFVNQFSMQVRFGKRDETSPFDRRKLRFTVERNQFRAAQSVLAVAWSVSPSEMPRRPDQMLPLVMQWGGDIDNVYSLNSAADWISNRFPDTDWSAMSLSPRDLTIWTNYWQNRLTASSRAQRIEFSRAGLIDGSDSQRLDLTAGDFRVPLFGGRSNAPGAAPDTLGPGPAFDAWRHSDAGQN